MPPGGGNSDADVELVADWIDNCVLEDRDALNGPSGEEGGEASTEEGGEEPQEGGESASEEGGEGSTEEGGESISEEGGEASTEEGGGQAMTWDTLKPFLEDDCGPCHFGGNATTFNYSYSSGGVGGSYYCATLSVAECFIERILDGTMPPPNSGIKVQSETVDAIEAWIEGGLLP